MRSEYLLRFAGGTRHTIGFQQQRENRSVFVDRFTGDVIPSAVIVHRIDRPEWTGDQASSSSIDASKPVAAAWGKLADRAVRRTIALFHLPHRGVAAMSGGRSIAAG